MLKYVNIGIVFQEIPDEVTLSINISNCPNHCPGCHSKYLWDDIGEELNEQAVDTLMAKAADNITCVCFMGGDADLDRLQLLADHLHSHHPGYKVGWYSGRIRVPRSVDKNKFDYIKIGPFIEHLGPINKPSTNQRLYRKRGDGSFEDITVRFWEKHM